MLKERNKLRSALGHQEQATNALRSQVAHQDSAIAALERQVYFGGLLQKDAQANATVWKAKARKRSWIILALSTLAAGITYTAITR